MAIYLVHVLRNTLGDCTNNGITNQHKSLYLIDGDDAPPEGRPALKVVRRNLGGLGTHIHAEPVTQPDEYRMCGPMAGGNFVFTTDQRFVKAFGGRPIPVHDRFETWEAYHNNFE